MTTPEEREESLAADRAARALARTEFTRPVVLEAGAGTGKTTTLVARVVSWVLDAGWSTATRRCGPGADAATIATRTLDGVVAITFTEAAAADMDHKIRAALAVLEAGGAPTGMSRDELPLADEERRARAARLRVALERPIALTIHSFCRAILARHPLEAGLRPEFEVDPKGRDVREHARACVAEDLARDVDGGVDPDWIVLAAREVGPSGVEDALFRLILDGVRDVDLERESFPPEVLVRLQTRMEVATRTFVEEAGPALARLPAGRGKSGIALLHVLRDLLSKTRPPAEDEVEFARRARAAEDLVPESARERLAKYARRKFNDTETEAFGSDADIVHTQAILLDRAWRCFVEVDPELERAARRILRRLLAAARARLVREGIETFGDLLRDTVDLLERDADLCRRLRGEIDTLLVDEFQDTDPLQCRLVDALALEDSRGPRPSLLLVGDPKQSIYGWRRADLAEYDRFKKRVCEFDGQVGKLSLNFRSLSPILEHVGKTFATIMREEEGVQPAFQGLHAHRDGDGARVEFWNTWCHPAGDAPWAGTRAETTRVEARFLARELRRSHDAGQAWRDLAVLMRTMSNIDAYLDALRDAGIPFEVAGDKSYYRRREILDLAAFLSSVVDPLDHVALVAYLRSPFVGVPDALLAPLWDAGLPDCLAVVRDGSAPSLAPAREAIARALGELPTDVPGLDRVRGFEASLDHAVEVLATLRATFHAEPVDVFLERARFLLLAEVTAGARFQGRFRLANVERFLGEIEVELERNGGDAQALLRFLRTSLAEAEDTAEARPRDAAGDAVQVLTIHKSKGLDFREVFLVGLERGSGGRSRRREDTACEGVEHVLFGAPTPGWFDVVERRKKREEAESVRLLYVALTRAKDRLVLSASLPETKVDGEVAVASGLLRHVAIPSRARSFFVEWTPRTESELELGGVQYRVAAAPDDLGQDDERQGDGARRESTRAANVSADRVAADSRRLTDLRHAAEARARRSARGRMSDDRASRVDDSWAAEFDDEPVSGGDAATTNPVRRLAPGDAALVGTLVHSLLQDVDLAELTAAPSASVRDAARRALATVSATLAGRAAAWISRASTGTSVHDVERDARRILDAFAGGPAFEHWTRIAPHVIARELPLVHASTDGEDEGGVVTRTGSVDLVWRDPSTGELVLVDYKTDDVTDESGMRARVEHHRAQIEAYREALRVALGLARPPRAELWFLTASRVVAV